MGISFGTVTGSKFYTDSLVIPLKRLSDGVRRISKNDFSGEDLQVEYEDELGELVEAFNQMKKATAQHVRTLEENYALTEELHREELQRMEAEPLLPDCAGDFVAGRKDSQPRRSCGNTEGSCRNQWLRLRRQRDRKVRACELDSDHERAENQLCESYHEK